MYSLLKNIAVRSIAAVAPTGILDNEKFAADVDDKKIRRRILYTGIKKRHTVVGQQRASDLVCIAAERILEHLHWDRDSIGTLIFITQSPDLRAPSTAMLIQAKLGLSQNLLAFDVNLGCSGFPSGIQIMSGILNQTKSRGLLLMGDCKYYTSGREFDADSFLFGDGGAAAALEYDESAPDMPAFQMTDGSRVKVLCKTYEHGRIMDGNKVVLFSLNEVVDSIKDFHEYFGINKKDVDYYAMHQAQKIIVDGIADNCELEKEKVLEIYQEYGNTTSASVPFAICGNTDKYKKEILSFFCCGYGIGLAWCGVMIRLNRENIIALEESDYAYLSLF